MHEDRKLTFHDLLQKKRSYIAVWMALTGGPGSVALIFWRPYRGLIFSAIEIAIVFFFSYLSALGMWSFTVGLRKRVTELEKDGEGPAA